MKKSKFKPVKFFTSMNDVEKYLSSVPLSMLEKATYFADREINKISLNCYVVKIYNHVTDELTVVNT